MVATGRCINQNDRKPQGSLKINLNHRLASIADTMLHTNQIVKSNASHKANFIGRVTALLVLLLASQIAETAHADDTTQRLRTCVARMNHWLGSGDKAQTWRMLLDLNVLDSQTAKGEQADPQTLSRLLGRFDQKKAAEAHPVFLEVRNAISAQIDQINRTRTQELADLQFAAYQAISQFEKPSVLQLEFDRDLAKYELQVLKKVYRRDLDSRSRAIIFHKLKLDQTIEFLEGIQFEMPPEVSVGKMKSMIADERSRLEEVVDAIDALPIQLPEEDSDEGDLELEQDTPGPDSDSGDDLKSLEARKEAIEERISELRKKYSEVFEADRPRLIRRRDIGRELRRIQRRFVVMAKEQTDPAFASAREAIDIIADEFEFATGDNIQQEYLEQVTELAELLPELNDPNARLSHARIGSILLWLENRQQLQDLCVAIRRRYSNPNAYVSVSSRMLQSLTSRSSSENDRIAEDFLGRFARGLSTTSTTVNVVPIDNPDQVHVSILLNGTATTDTYVRERIFRINSSSSGYLSARRDLFANLNGLWATQSSVDASMSSQYGGISTNCGLIQRLAEKSFTKEQGRTDEESSRRVRERLRDRFESETSNAIGDGVGQVESFAKQARDIAAFLPQIFLRSFSNRVEVVAKKDARIAISAPANPTFQTAGSDVQIKLHDSLPSIYLDPIFAGKTFTQSELEAEVKSFVGDADVFAAAKSAAEDAVEEDVEEFKISFQDIRPIQFEFSDNRLGVVINGSRFEQGENAIRTNLSIKLAFKVVSRNGKLFIKADGTPEIDLSEGEEPDAESIAFAKILEKRIAEAAEASGGEGFELPSNLLPSLPQLSGLEFINALQLGLLELRDGWLYLGWNYQGGSVNTPAIWNEYVVQEFDPLYLPDGAPILEQPQDDSVLIDPPPPADDVSSQTIILDSGAATIETGLGQ